MSEATREGRLMNGNRSSKKLLWRWRNNPLRRHGDVVEAWVVLTVWVIATVGGTVIGLLTFHAADGVFTHQHMERHPVRPVLLADVPREPAGTLAANDNFSAPVRWTAPGSSVHTDNASVNTGLDAGSRVLIWANGKDQVVTEPPTPSEAVTKAGLLATGAVFAFVGLALGVGCLARRNIERQHFEQWDREWELVGPRWGRKTG
ncbi:Rv1733c family protein [Streptomyces lydicus]|uniref:Rv1733c family protein n=1 Tax=Streptomyces lydicus TaxID=47763 RepID=UPI00287062BF|nr:hypothetical protein [Streptomyces lydicus]